MSFLAETSSAFRAAALSLEVLQHGQHLSLCVELAWRFASPSLTSDEAEVLLDVVVEAPNDLEECLLELLREFLRQLRSSIGFSTVLVRFLDIALL